MARKKIEGPKVTKRERHKKMAKRQDLGDLYHVGLKPGGPTSCTIGGVMFCVEQRAFQSLSDSIGQRVFGNVQRFTPQRRDEIFKHMDKTWVQWEGNIEEEDPRFMIPGQAPKEDGIGPDKNRSRCRIVKEGSSGFEPNDDQEPIENYLYFFPIASVDQQLSGMKPTIEEMKSETPAEQLQAEAQALQDAHTRKIAEIRRHTEETARLLARPGA